MGAPTSKRVGLGACLLCGSPLVYRESKGLLLTWRADCCDVSGYATPGGDGYRKAMETIKNPVAPTPTPPKLEPELPPGAIQPPPKKPAGFAFGL